jgi:tetratricopeptide (TPR) repeat protein
VRLFKNHLGYKYKYSLHELLDAGDLSIGMYASPLKIFHYGYNSVDIDRQKRALVCLQKDLKKYPGDLFVKFNLARTYYLTDQSDQVVALMDEVIEKYLKNPELRREIPLALIYKYYVNMLFGLKMYERALKVTFDWLTRLRDNYDPRPYVALGKAYYMLDRDEEAQKILELAQNSLKKNIPFDYPEEIPYIEKDINYFLGCLYLDRGNPREALKLLTWVKKRFMLNDANIDKLISIAVMKSR